MILKALIVGAGNIGAAYDEPDSKVILTHAHAYAEHKNFEIGGFVDTDTKKLAAAVKRWGGKAYASLNEAFQSDYFDVVSVAVPTNLHFQVLKQLIKYKPRVVFAEKPFVCDLKEYRKLRAESGFNKIRYCLNYRRRFVQEIQDLRNKIKRNAFGALISGGGYYGKGFVHNGTHLLDLLNFLIGDFKRSEIHSSLVDFSKSDPSYSVRLQYPGNASVNISAVDSRLFTVFELDLLFEKKRIRISDIGNQIEEFDVEKSNVYPDYRFLKARKPVRTGLPKALFFAVDNIYKNIIGEAELFCTEKDAVVLLNQIRKILKRSKDL